MATSDTVSDALGWVSLGFKIFPVDPDTKRPLIENGHLAASDDPEQVATWFSVDFPKARIAYATGASGVVVADPDRKNGKDGFAAVDEAWLDLPDTFHYPTPNGGGHYVYAAPEGKRLSGVRNYRGLVGLDRRGGSSYAVAYAPPPDSRDVFAPAPEWLCDEAKDPNGEGYPGDYLDWLNGLPEGDPTQRVKSVIDNLPTDAFGHEDVTRITYNLIRLAAEGHTGVDWALEQLQDRWIRPPYDDPEHRKEFWDAVYGAVAKAGALPALPDYSKALESLPPEFDMQRWLFGKPADDPKAANRHVFDTIRELVRLGVERDTIAAVLYGAPKLKPAVEWGIDYVYESIDAARGNADTTVSPSIHDEEEYRPADYPNLMDDTEREQLSLWPTFIDLYLALAGERVKMLNRPYHVMQAVQLLSMAFAFQVFIPESEGSLGVNFFAMGLGPSSSGKTRALKIRDQVLRAMYAEDPQYDLGSNPSLESLHDNLLDRNRMVAFFNGDEAARFFAQVAKEGSYLAGMLEFLTDLYEGRVKPMLRRGKKTDNTRTALVHFNFAMMGTPERVTELWTQDMFSSGFLPRFVFFLSDAIVETDDQYEVSEASRQRGNREDDPALSALGHALKALAARGTPHAMYTSEAARHRLARASKNIKQYLQSRHNWDMLDPVWKRMAGEHLRKLATLFAAWDASPTVELRHVLCALPYVEEWTYNAVLVSEQVTASKFQREADEIHSYLVAKGGTLPKYALARVYKRFEPKEMFAFTKSLEEQGRIKEVGNTWVAQ